VSLYRNVGRIDEVALDVLRLQREDHSHHDLFATLTKTTRDCCLLLVSTYTHIYAP
jgi:hypothetical protein